jgi:hypothetical protein
MQRRAFFFLALLLAIPALAQAAVTVTVGNHNLLQNTSGQVINIMLSGAGGSDVYSATDWKSTIAAGGPKITHVFNDTDGAIPGGNLAGSIWAGGSAGINLFPNGTTTAGTGQQTAGTNTGPSGGTVNQTTNGIFVTLTLDTTGVAPGSYLLSLLNHPDGATKVLFWSEDDIDLFDVPGLVLQNGNLNVVPEPSSVVVGLFAVAGFAFVAARRHRARKAA